MIERQLDLYKSNRQRGVAMRANPTEFRVACAFSDTLRRFGRADWKFSAFPAGEHRAAITGERLRRMGLAKGWPDYLFISPQGQLHCLELKRRRGGQLTTEQAEFRDWCAAHGVPWCVAYSYDDAIAAVTAWGVLKREVRPQ